VEREVEAGEWQRLNEFEAYRRRSRQGKIITTYRCISNRINQLLGFYYQLVKNNPKKSVKLLEEIKRLRFLQNFLLDCLLLEKTGELKPGKIPPELENLL